MARSLSLSRCSLSTALACGRCRGRASGECDRTGPAVRSASDRQPWPAGCVPLARQSLAIQLFVRAWSAYRPAVEACVDVLGDAPSEVVERVAREVSRHLGTVTLEALGAHELRVLVARLKRG